jgi:hypothetical protein
MSALADDKRRVRKLAPIVFALMMFSLFSMLNGASG